MDIRFKSIDIDNFRSIENASVSLEKQGTVIVKGINEYEDKATSNGSGKSSIFEAIVFALFDETSSGDKDVANRIINNGYNIKLQFDIDNTQYIIVRNMIKNKQTVSLFKDNIDISARNRTDTNKLILQILGINKNIFLDSVFLSQTVSTNLTSLSPTARKERLEILTNTDLLVSDFKETMKVKQDEYENLCNQNQVDLNKLESKKSTLLEQKMSLQRKVDEVNEQIRQRDLLGNIDDVNNSINITEQNIKIQEDDLNDKNLELQKVDDKINEHIKLGEQNYTNQNEYNTKINEKRQEYNSLYSNISQCKLRIDMHNKDINNLQLEIQKITTSDRCPTCGRKYDNVNEEHIQSKVNEITESIEINKNDIVQIEQEMKQYEEKQLEVEKEGKELSNKLADIQTKINEHSNVLSTYNEQKQNIKMNILRIQENINAFKTSLEVTKQQKEKILTFKVGNKEEYEELIKQIDKDIENIDKDIFDINSLYNTNNAKVLVIKHCIQLLTKEFRTYLLQNSIQYLNNLLIRYSKDLFSNTNDIIKITSDDSKLDIMLGDATYESLSGGEKTRVNIALLLAQKSLSNIIGNISCNLIILDEILGYCDAQAEINVVDLITKELDTLESIYMISHKEIPIGYDSQLLVIKDINGLSHIKIS